MKLSFPKPVYHKHCQHDHWIFLYHVACKWTKFHFCWIYLQHITEEHRKKTRILLQIIINANSIWTRLTGQ